MDPAPRNGRSGLAYTQDEPLAAPLPARERTAPNRNSWSGGLPIGGGCEIRTHGDIAATTVFKTFGLSGGLCSPPQVRGLWTPRSDRLPRRRACYVPQRSTGCLVGLGAPL
ncbi:hypothetical protein SSIG_03643 [Streptomyces filamentosus NRRL 11379]|uniref:Predicted protein n=1 Tax=Streptomyces filamentosus NRRL 15998 TaxID=457431 RepID=D6ASW9_STRFL|nr:predicted protein [Streptomyces filamentosus NRRL 15998]EWS93079.1 hypothetical protein SSIG_03643 [Streptomyces filamentosus NRRL 11379]